MSASSFIARISPCVTENKVKTDFKATKKDVVVIANLDKIKTIKASH